jgi:hypothetical protein
MLEHNSAAISVRSPPPCGEGLGVGVVQLFAGGANVISLHHPPPQPSPSRLRACPLPANLRVTKPRQAGVWLGEGADRVCRCR